MVFFMSFYPTKPDPPHKGHGPVLILGTCECVVPLFRLLEISDIGAGRWVEVISDV